LRKQWQLIVLIVEQSTVVVRGKYSLGTSNIHIHLFKLVPVPVHDGWFVLQPHVF